MHHVSANSALVFFASVLLASTCSFNLVAKETSTQKPYGIDHRVPWTTSRITGSLDPPSPYSAEKVFPAIAFQNPVELVVAPGLERIFVAELNGKIFSFDNSYDCKTKQEFLDLTKSSGDKVRIYGMEFHPDFQRNGYCYICYITDQNTDDGTRVSRFKVEADEFPRIDPESEEILLTWRSGGHNGGCLRFGPDGFLYISTGDAGPAFPPDPLKSGQDVSNVLSSVLRIDVNQTSGDLPYAIPADNPFVGLEDARHEIWAYGMRNPWRMSFDSTNGDLWVGDVGWELWEMIYRVQRGGNYGWSLVEGSQPVHQERARGPTPILPPTVEHSHIESRSITGGYFYRGDRLKDLVGAYIYGDYVTGKIWAIRHDGKEVTWQQELADTPLQIICFGVDHAGELYVVDYHGGIYRLMPNPQTSINEDFPQKLSETGIFSSVQDHRLAAGVVPYSINAEPWADGAIARRFVALPGASKLGVHESTNAQIGYIKGMWKFPSDSVLGKTLSMEMKRGDPSSQQHLETQILHFNKDAWNAYTYIWNDEQTDAVLAPDEGIDRVLEIADATSPNTSRKQTWHFASRNECMLCHSTRGGTVYGFKPSQLNCNHNYDAVVDNQLRTLSHIELIEKPLDGKAPKLPSPYDLNAELEQRARSYLHVNCAHCHQRGGGGTAAIELKFELPLEKTHLLDARPTQGTFGISKAQVLAPGDPYRSVLYYRMAKLGRGRMPYFGSSTVDEEGVRLIHDWIESLGEDDASASEDELSNSVSESIRRLNDSEETTETVDRLLTSTARALALLHFMEKSQLSTKVRTQIIEHGAVHSDVQIRDLFERFVPEENRTKRLGTVIDEEQLLAKRGDSDRGKSIFFKTAGVQCKSCHKIGTEGGSLGPDLTQIGKKYNRLQLLESILRPSKAIDPKFGTYLVETLQGRVHAGLLITKTDESVVLKTAPNKEIRIAVEDIELFAPQQKSMMPELLLQDMTADQVADLLEFLLSLR